MQLIHTSERFFIQTSPWRLLKVAVRVKHIFIIYKIQNSQISVYHYEANLPRNRIIWLSSQYSFVRSTLKDSSSLHSTSISTSDAPKSVTDLPAEGNEVVNIDDDESPDSNHVVDRSKNNQIPTKPGKNLYCNGFSSSVKKFCLENGCWYFFYLSDAAKMFTCLKNHQCFTILQQGWS